MGKGARQTFLQRRHINGHSAHGKMFVSSATREMPRGTRDTRSPPAGCAQEGTDRLSVGEGTEKGDPCPAGGWKAEQLLWGTVLPSLERLSRVTA